MRRGSCTRQRASTSRSTSETGYSELIIMLMRQEQSCRCPSSPMHRKNRGRRIPGLLFLLLTALTWNDVHLDTLSPEQRKSNQVIESPPDDLWSNALITRTAVSFSSFCSHSRLPECNRTFYGEVGLKYPLRFSEPLQRFHPFHCDIKFAPVGGRTGDTIIELTFLSFQVGSYEITK